ncbi:MAG: hypothetical protein LBL24_03715 [Bacteroidales bacterium]|jgi:hypothetical protein|nr:hypothetical protein [Bacteroidales bacterium]
MIIDTKEEATTLWRTKTFAIAVYLVLVVTIVAFLPVDKTVKILICAGLSVIFLALYWFQYMMEYTYFYFSSNNKNLVFRFYSLRNFYGRPKTIEIAKTSLMKYDITTGFFNKKESLVLYQKTEKGVAKYPSISLTLLSRNQKTELKRALFTTIQ